MTVTVGSVSLPGENSYLPNGVTDVPRELLKGFPHSKKVGNYLLGKTLGEGSFAKVKEGLHVLTGEKVAVKVMDKKKAREDAYVRKNLRREGKLLSAVRHPNVVQLLEVMETENSYYLVTELCRGGDLMELICSKKRLDERTVKKYIKQILQAVQHLHALGILHRDLKVENLLLDENKNIKIIGDQVLEWNGIPLTGKTYEEVQSIISQPNGEIELVVRPGADMTGKSATMSTLRSESCHSSYDNLDFVSDYDDYERYLEPQQGVDPSLLAAQLEGIQQKQQQQQPPTPHQGRHQKGPAPRAPPPEERREVRDVRNVAPANHHHQHQQQQRRHVERDREREREREREPPGGGRERHARMSPGISPTSSQPETYATPNMSTPLSSPPSPRTEMANQINELIIAQQNEELPPDEVPTKRPTKRDQFGRILLQLNYDDYDGSLNVVVISARGLQAKDKNGYSDPFARVQLLPGRMNREDLQETKTIMKTLDPEWNQTLIFLNLPRDELIRQKLKLTLWDYDRFKSDDFMGELALHLSDTSYLNNKPQWYNLYDEGDCEKKGPIRALPSPLPSPRPHRRTPQRRDPSPGRQEPFTDQQQNLQQIPIQQPNRSPSPSRKYQQQARQLPAVGEPGDSSSSSDRPPPREHHRGRDVSPGRRQRSREQSRGRERPASRETSRSREPVGRERSPPPRHRSRERNHDQDSQSSRESDVRRRDMSPGRHQRESSPPQRPRSRRGSRDQSEQSPTRQRVEPTSGRRSTSPSRRGQREGSPGRRRRGSRESLEGRGPDRQRARSRESSPGRERKPSRGREMPVPPGGDRPREPRDLRGPRDPRDPRDRGPRDRRGEPRDPRGRGRESPSGHRGRESPGAYRGHGPRGPPRDRRDEPPRGRESPSHGPPRGRDHRGRESPSQEHPRGRDRDGRESPNQRGRESPRGAPQGQSGDERPPPPKPDQEQLQQQQQQGAISRDQQHEQGRPRPDQGGMLREDSRSRMDQGPPPRDGPRDDGRPQEQMNRSDMREEGRRGPPERQQSDWRNQDWRDRDMPARGPGGRPELLRQESKEGKPKPPSQGGVLRDPSTGRVVDLTKPPSQGGVIRDPITGNEMTVLSGGIGLTGVIGRESPFTRSQSQESLTSGTGEGPARGSPAITMPGVAAQARPPAGRGRGATPSPARKPPQPDPPQQEQSFMERMTGTVTGFLGSALAGCKIKMGLSALSSPTNGLHGNSLDRLGNKRLSTPDDLDDSSSVWHPRPVDRESMARITQYFTQASLSTHGDIDFDELKASRSLGYLNTIASETSTEDEFAAEMSFHNAGAKSQPRLVHYVDNSDVHPTIVVDFRPIEPMPTSPSARPKSKGKSIGVSPSISVDRIPKISAKSKNFVQEARELYRSHFGAPSHEDTVLYSEYEFDEPVHHHHRHHHHKQDPTDYQISAHQVYNKGSSFWKSYHAPEVMTAKSHPSSSSVRQPEEPPIDKDKYKLRPTLQTPPFPTDLTLSPKLAVYSGTAYKEASMEQDSVYDGASSSSVIKESHRNSVPMQRSEKVEDQQQENQPLSSSSKTNTAGGIEREQYKRHSRHSSHPSFGAKKDIPDINEAAVIPDPPAYRQIFPDVQVQSEHIRSQQLQQQQKKDFSCCSLGKDLQKQQQMFGPQEPTPIPETSVKASNSPGKKRHSRHYRSNSTPFPSPCNFIDLLADDPNTPRDPYNHYNMTASQPSLANANSSDRISSHSVNEFSNIGNNKVTTSCSAGNIPRGTTTPSDSEMKEESATLGKQPKKQRYIKHKKSPSNHSCGALSGLTASSSSGTTLVASSGKSSETLRPDEQSPVSLESRLQYFFRQQAAAEGLIPPVDSTLEHHTANSNLGVGQILPSLLSPSGRGSSYSVTGELMLGLQPGIGHESLVLNVLRAKDLSDQFIDLTKKREWHCLVSYQDYNKSRTKQFRSHAVKAIYDPVFHEIFGFKVNGLEGLVQVKLLCRKGIFSQKKKVGSIYLCLERIPFENYENGELIAWYKLLKKR